MTADFDVNPSYVVSSESPDQRRFSGAFGVRITDCYIDSRAKRKPAIAAAREVCQPKTDAVFCRRKGVDCPAACPEFRQQNTEVLARCACAELGGYRRIIVRELNDGCSNLRLSAQGPFSGRR